MIKVGDIGDVHSQLIREVGDGGLLNLGLGLWQASRMRGNGHIDHEILRQDAHPPRHLVPERALVEVYGTVRPRFSKHEGPKAIH